VLIVAFLTAMPEPVTVPAPLAGFAAACQNIR